MAETIAVNVAYALYVSSGFVKTEWRLRMAMVVVSVAFIVWAVIAQLWSPVAWNVAFGLTHSFHLHRMWQANRAIQLSDEAEEVHARLFRRLSRLDFHALWSIGSTNEFDPGEVLIRQGAADHNLLIVLRGQVSVARDGESLATLGPDALLGERAFVTGDPASAEVTALSGGAVHSWNMLKVQALGDLYPTAHAALVAQIGVDLAVKLK